MIAFAGPLARGRYMLAALIAALAFLAGAGGGLGRWLDRQGATLAGAADRLVIVAADDDPARGRAVAAMLRRRGDLAAIAVRVDGATLLIDARLRAGAAPGAVAAALAGQPGVAVEEDGAGLRQLATRLHGWARAGRVLAWLAGGLALAAGAMAGGAVARTPTFVAARQLGCGPTRLALAGAVASLPATIGGALAGAAAGFAFAMAVAGPRATGDSGAMAAALLPPAALAAAGAALAATIGAGLRLLLREGRW